MILTDKEIEKLAAENMLIASGYKESSVKGIAYELSIDCIYDSQKKEKISLNCNPGEVVYIKTEEEICLPENITARIIERNSVMRMGLAVSGPQYIPGHKTFCFLRIQNISDSIITLTKGFKVAQVLFEELKEIPRQTYSNQPDASFRDETEYIGCGRYQPEYDKLIKKYRDIKEDIESMKEKIYGNVLTIMGIFVSIFTLISINIQAFANETLSKRLIATVNLSLLSCITVLLGFVLLIINKGKKKWFCIAYLIFILGLAAATFATAFFN